MVDTFDGLRTVIVDTLGGSDQAELLGDKVARAVWTALGRTHTDPRYPPDPVPLADQHYWRYERGLLPWRRYRRCTDCQLTVRLHPGDHDWNRRGYL